MKVHCQNPLCDNTSTPVDLPEGATRCCFCGDMYHWHDVNFARSLQLEEAIKKIEKVRDRYLYIRFVISIFISFAAILAINPTLSGSWLLAVAVVMASWIGYFILALFLCKKKFPFPEKNEHP